MASVWPLITCAAETSCSNCTHFGCIWCGDEQGCHAELSPYGCVYAVPCNNLDHCMRHEPESLPHGDYAHINGAVTIITSLIAIIIILSLWLIFRFVKKYRAKILKIERNEMGDIKLERFLNDPYQPFPADVDDDVPNLIPFEVKTFAQFNSPLYQIEMESSQSNRISMSESILSVKLLREAEPKKNVNKDKYVKCTRCVTITGVIVTVMLAVMTILLFPTTPTYFVCNAETDWNAIFESLAHGSLQVNFDSLYTIKNNNYFSVQLKNVGLRIYFEQSLIGYYYSKQDVNASNVYLQSHSLVDVLVPITMKPGLAESITIYDQYQRNNLSLEINFFADTQTYLFNKDNNIRILDLHVNLQFPHYLVGANISTDRAYCNCPEDIEK